MFLRVGRSFKSSLRSPSRSSIPINYQLISTVNSRRNYSESHDGSHSEKKSDDTWWFAGAAAVTIAGSLYLTSPTEKKHHTSPTKTPSTKATPKEEEPEPEPEAKEIPAPPPIADKIEGHTEQDKALKEMAASDEFEVIDKAEAGEAKNADGKESTDSKKDESETPSHEEKPSTHVEKKEQDQGKEEKKDQKKDQKQAEKKSK